MKNIIPAPAGVGWGTTNTPVKSRIDPAKKYKTRDGKVVFGLSLVLHLRKGVELHETTFPVKGSISRGKGRMPRFHIWTLDGRSDLFEERGEDLILV